MTGIDVRSFNQPDETRVFEGKGTADVIEVAGRPVSLGRFEPGWRWSTNIRPIAGTELCETAHFGYVLSGHMRVRMSDGTVQDLRPGDVTAIEPGHDAEVVGDEACLFLDFGDIANYAKPH